MGRMRQTCLWCGLEKEHNKDNFNVIYGVLRKKCKECCRKKKKKKKKKRKGFGKILHSAVYGANRKARKYGLESKITAQNIKDRYEYYGNKCYYCGSNKKLTVDHRFPLSKGGLNCPSNIVPACMSCNQKKGTKLESEFFDWLLHKS
jgi:5-methylcytosine-specific restriction endonuclease McrA